MGERKFRPVGSISRVMHLQMIGHFSAPEIKKIPARTTNKHECTIDQELTDAAA